MYILLIKYSLRFQLVRQFHMDYLFHYLAIDDVGYPPLILNGILVFILLIKYSLRSQLVKQFHMDLHIPVENVIVKYVVVSRI